MYMLSLIYLFIVCQSIHVCCKNFEVIEESIFGTEIEGVSDYIKNLYINSDARYSLFGNERLHQVLRIDPSTAQLFVNGRIDREDLCPNPKFQRMDYNRIEQCDQKVQILARSTSSPTSTNRININIIIRDINDNPPHWTDKQLNHSFLESSDSGNLGQFVPLLRATDPDAGDNGLITYSLQEQTSYSLPFKLENQNNDLHLVPTARLDREERSNYTLRLIATDRGSNPLTGSVILKIIVEDINDHAPIFNQSIYLLDQDLSENTPVGTVLLTVFAKDKDSGRHGAIKYKIDPRDTSNAKNFFKVTSTGKIVVKEKLDFEKTPTEFRFGVIAEDSAPRPYQKSGTAEVSIKLHDENDEFPIINAHFLQNDPIEKLPLVNENSPPRTRIAYVTVTDLDYNMQDQIKCELSNKNFSIQFDSGKRNEYILSTDTKFDRETTPYQILTITCQDSAKNRANKNFKIKIGDLNDQAPVFLETFHFSIYENSVPPIKIPGGRIKAHDFDEGINKDLEYFIDPSFSQNFTIEPTTGQLKAKVSFDRELCQHYTIRVLAVDKGVPPKTGTGTVELTIADVNDWAPEFTEDMYVFSVSEDLKVHGKIGQVRAIDRDDGKHPKIDYYITRIEDRKMFHVGQKTGIITNNQRLDRETNYFYVIQVIAQDRGRIKSTATVTVTVIDVNDNKPVFVRPNQTVSIVTIDSGDYTLGKQVLKAEARDIDNGDNGRVTYKIKSGDPSQRFTLDAESGALFLSESFRRKKKTVFPLVLEACDHGQPQKCANTVTVRVVVSNQGGIDNEIRSPNRASGNEPIIICLAVIFAILVLATVVLICLIKRKSFWPRKKKKPHVSQPNIPHGDMTNPEDSRKPDTGELYEGETLLSKTAAHHGSALFLSELDANAKKKQMYAARMGTSLRRGSEPGMDMIHRPVSPEYQTLDSVCGTYRQHRGGGLHVSRLPQYSTGGFIVSTSCNPQNVNQQIYTPSLHTYYEINTPSSNTLERRRCQTLGRPRPPPRTPCDYGTHVFRPIPVATLDGGNDQYETTRTLERQPKGKYTYEAYKEASFV